MRLNGLLTDDDAVSPVIGVILMVAITVILAAVIASVVLGVGNQAQQDTPKASFSFSYDGGPTDNDQGLVEVTHESGDSISKEQVYVRGSGFTDVSGEFSDQDTHTAGEWQGTVSGSNSEVVSGDLVNVGVSSDYDIDVVYQSVDGETSTTLTSDEGPDA